MSDQPKKAACDAIKVQQGDYGAVTGLVAEIIKAVNGALIAKIQLPCGCACLVPATFVDKPQSIDLTPSRN